MADDLAGRVRRQEERLRDQLGAGPGEFMHVEFTAVVARPHRSGTIESAEVSEIATYFDLLAAPRRMVVLGEPGAGKTVATTHLMLGLLDDRRDLPDARRAEEPVPVRVNAAGWDGTEAFSRWLTTRLGFDYQLRAPIARALVDAGLVLPVLDGLDEMDPEHSDDPKAWEMLNRLNETPWKNRPVVVACRSNEFYELARRGQDNGLHGATSITLKSFSPDQIRAYLQGYRRSLGATAPAWDAVDARLRDQPDGPLAAALHTPWILALAANALQHAPDTARRLPDCPDPDAVRDFLFTAQIPAAIARTDRTGPYRDYTEDNVQTWLLALARCLDHRRDTGRDGTTIRLDQLWEIAGSTRARVLHGLASGLAAVPTFGLAFGLITGLLFGLTAGLTFGLTFGLVFGVALGLLTGLPIDSPTKHIGWRVSAGRSRLRVGLRYGLVTGLMMGLLFGLTAGLTFGLTFGLVFGVALGLLTGLPVIDNDKSHVSVDETRLIRSDIQAAALASVLLAPTFGLMMGLLLGHEFGRVFGFASGPAYGLAFGVLAVLAAGGTSVRYFVAALVFRFTSTFPSRPRLFLDWARRGGLLRVTGTAYQFRHETYRLWLGESARQTKDPDTAKQQRTTVL